MDTSSIKNIFDAVSHIAIEQNSDTQSLLNIDHRTRTSLFPWRGQFSPQLVEHILSKNARSEFCILDPFCGSGTTLYEAARRQFSCYGADVNPAAYLFASIVQFSNIAPEERLNIIRAIRRISSQTISYSQGSDLFDYNNPQKHSFINQLFEFYQESQYSFFSHLISAVSIMLAMADSDMTTPERFFKSLNLVLDTIQTLRYTEKECFVLLNDARFLELKDSTIDLIVTSPPYINVFNYHQNYRKAIESLGWKPLQVAISEIGANRKHRGNRFLTVIQYCMDMCDAFVEMRRVLCNQGKAIIIVGRTSSVRGIRFQNGLLLAMIATGCAGFTIERRQERFFKNRFGEEIYEDILTLRPKDSTIFNGVEFAKNIGIWALENSIKQAIGEVKIDIEKAIFSASDVQSSPRLHVQTPLPYNNFNQYSFMNNPSKILAI